MSPDQLRYWTGSDWTRHVQIIPATVGAVASAPAHDELPPADGSPSEGDLVAMQALPTLPEVADADVPTSVHLSVDLAASAESALAGIESAPVLAVVSLGEGVLPREHDHLGRAAEPARRARALPPRRAPWYSRRRVWALAGMVAVLAGAALWALVGRSGSPDPVAGSAPTDPTLRVGASYIPSVPAADGQGSVCDQEAASWKPTSQGLSVTVHVAGPKTLVVVVVPQRASPGPNRAHVTAVAPAGSSAHVVSVHVDQADIGRVQLSIQSSDGLQICDVQPASGTASGTHS